jgi:hypothetical protein
VPSPNSFRLLLIEFPDLSGISKLIIYNNMLYIIYNKTKINFILIEFKVYPNRKEWNEASECLFTYNGAIENGVKKGRAWKGFEMDVCAVEEVKKKKKYRHCLSRSERERGWLVRSTTLCTGGWGPIPQIVSALTWGFSSPRHLALLSTSIVCSLLPNQLDGDPFLTAHSKNHSIPTFLKAHNWFISLYKELCYYFEI